MIKAIGLVRWAFQETDQWAAGAAEDLRDAPLVRPTSRGGNHPLWTLGHLVEGRSSLAQEGRRATIRYVGQSSRSSWSDRDEPASAAFEEGTMKGKGTAKPDPRESGPRFRPIILWLACLALMVLICVPLLPLVALAVVLPRIVDLIGTAFLESLTTFVASLTVLILLAAHSTWLLLLGDYAGLIRLGPQVIDWLRSAGLL